jgi:hypothetical protein
MPGVEVTRSVVVAPGGSRAASPLLAYARLAAERRGARVRALAWDFPVGADFLEQRERVAAQLAAAVAEMTADDGTAPAVIGKSLGSLAAPVTADLGLAAVWLTPLLSHAPTAAALRRATAPCLLVGGTADRFWDGAAARSVTADVVEVDGADHSMLVPGGLAASAAILGRVAAAVEEFLDRAVWPS